MLVRPSAARLVPRTTSLKDGVLKSCRSYPAPHLPALRLSTTYPQTIRGVIVSREGCDLVRMDAPRAEAIRGRLPPPGTRRRVGGSADTSKRALTLPLRAVYPNSQEINRAVGASRRTGAKNGRQGRTAPTEAGRLRAFPREEHGRKTDSEGPTGGVPPARRVGLARGMELLPGAGIPPEGQRVPISGGRHQEGHPATRAAKGRSAAGRGSSLESGDLERVRPAVQIRLRLRTGSREREVVSLRGDPW